MDEPVALRAPLKEEIATAICRSGRFETGEGTCALTCMDQLGDPRTKGCHHASRVHGKMADAIVAVLPEPSADLISAHTEACDAADYILALMTMEFGRLMVEGPDEEIEVTMCGHSVRIPANYFNRLYNATNRSVLKRTK